MKTEFRIRFASAVKNRKNGCRFRGLAWERMYYRFRRHVCTFAPIPRKPGSAIRNKPQCAVPNAVLFFRSSSSERSTARHCQYTDAVLGPPYQVEPERRILTLTWGLTRYKSGLALSLSCSLICLRISSLLILLRTLTSSLDNGAVAVSWIGCATSGSDFFRWSGIAAAGIACTKERNEKQRERGGPSCDVHDVLSDLRRVYTSISRST